MCVFCVNFTQLSDTNVNKSEAWMNCQQQQLRLACSLRREWHKCARTHTYTHRIYDQLYKLRSTNRNSIRSHQHIRRLLTHSAIDTQQQKNLIKWIVTIFVAIKNTDNDSLLAALLFLIPSKVFIIPSRDDHHHKFEKKQNEIDIHLNYAVLSIYTFFITVLCCTKQAAVVAACICEWVICLCDPFIERLF